ncbi:hypothetical protein [Romboutsia sp.]|uniref:hypothetical protein n=1 Tax=Romboutsia sp. TaxID=1965302 RepID=UPI002CD4D9A6|nr:hypothetical protein [Romboutsia sp.]HSQ87770.1 hypothetical protein [Romboutsia sp.]
MSKKLINVGDIFGTWTVIGLEENDRKYNYNYICKCECGNKKAIRKDVLLNLMYPKCDKCLSNGIIDRKMDLITSRWSSTLNGKLVTSRLDVGRQYAWTCSEGHTYSKSILLLNKECPVCEQVAHRDHNKKQLVQSFNMIVDYIDEVTAEVFENVVISIDEENLVIWAEINDVIILMLPNVHKRFNEGTHETKSEYYDILSKIKGHKTRATQSTKEHIFLDLDLNTKDIKKILGVLGIVKSKTM